MFKRIIFVFFLLFSLNLFADNEKELNEEDKLIMNIYKKDFIQGCLQQKGIEEINEKCICTWNKFSSSYNVKELKYINNFKEGSEEGEKIKNYVIKLFDNCGK